MSSVTSPQDGAPAPVPSPAQAAGAVARALDGILGALFSLLWTRAITAHVLGALAGPVTTRILRTQERIARALARLAAGRAPRRPRPATRAARPRTPFPNRRHGWLAAMLDHRVRASASQLAALLHQPGVAETIAAAPGAARTLRPLCRMLGVDLPAPLRLPPRAAPPPKTPRPQRPKAPRPPPLDPPLQPYVLAAARAWRRPGFKNE